MSPRALLLTGTVGVGKTTVAAAVGDLLRERQVANAVMLGNLSAVAAGYGGAGFSPLLLAGGLETAEDRTRHEQAVRVPLTVCRLVADPEAVHRRLHARHRDDADGLGWHLHRAGELAAVQDASAVEDLRLDVTELPVRGAAVAVLDLWDRLRPRARGASPHPRARPARPT